MNLLLSSLGFRRGDEESDTTLNVDMALDSALAAARSLTDDQHRKLAADEYQFDDLSREECIKAIETAIDRIRDVLRNPNSAEVVWEYAGSGVVLALTGGWSHGDPSTELMSHIDLLKASGCFQDARDQQIEIDIAVEGGNVQSVVTNEPCRTSHLRMRVLDYDTDGADPCTLVYLKDIDGTTAEVLVGDLGAPEQSTIGIAICECEKPGHFYSGFPGIIAHIEPDGTLAANAKIERCDLCERFGSDEAAKHALESRLAIAAQQKAGKPQS